MTHPIRETASYTDAIEKIGDVKAIDGALESVMWGLYTKPDEFPLVPGFMTVRLAKTSSVLRSDGTVVPGLQVRFRILPDKDETVELLHVDSDESDS